MRFITVDLRTQYPEVAQRIPQLAKYPKIRGKVQFAKVDTSKAEAVFEIDWKTNMDSNKESVLDVMKWEKENNVQ